jgi:hypothetical protein
VVRCYFNKHESLALEACNAFIGVSRKELEREVENQNEPGGTCSAKVNVFKCRRNSADVGVQVLDGLGCVSLQVRDAANEEFNNVIPVYQRHVSFLCCVHSVFYVVCTVHFIASLIQAKNAQDY